MVNVGPTTPTQVARPWRATFRTVVQGVIAAAAILPLVFAAGGIAPVGVAGIVIAVAGAVTRIMALPAVEEFLQNYVPFLAAKPKTDN